MKGDGLGSAFVLSITLMFVIAVVFMFLSVIASTCRLAGEFFSWIF